MKPKTAKKAKAAKPGVAALLDFHFLGDFRRFSRRFSHNFRRFLSMSCHDSINRKYYTMTMYIETSTVT